MSDAKLRDGVSEITEIPEQANLGHFLAPLVWGTIAGTVTMLIGLGWEAGFDIDLADVGAAVLFVGVFVFLFTFTGFIAIGLPFTLLLRTIGKETVGVYAAIGAIGGFLLIAVIFETHRMGGWDGLWFPVVGALAGIACAYRWGRWRESVARRRKVAEETIAQRRSNPIHDLTH